jgi:hypothetical protein
MGETIIGDIICSTEWLLNLSFDLVEYPITDNFIIRVS